MQTTGYSQLLLIAIMRCQLRQIHNRNFSAQYTYQASVTEFPAFKPLQIGADEECLFTKIVGYSKVKIDVQLDDALMRSCDENIHKALLFAATGQSLFI